MIVIMIKCDFLVMLFYFFLINGKHTEKCYGDKASKGKINKKNSKKDKKSVDNGKRIW